MLILLVSFLLSRWFTNCRDDILKGQHSLHDKINCKEEKKVLISCSYKQNLIYFFYYSGTYYSEM